MALLLPAGAHARLEVVELGGAPTAGASSIRVGDFSGAGVRTNGRILGFDPRDGDYSCSGTALSTPSRSIVLTAGHCVLEQGSIGRELIFIPAYDHGARPFGTFDVEVAYMMPQWRHSENPDFDVAALRVAPEPARSADRRRRRPRLRDRPLPPRQLPDLRLPGGGAGGRRDAQLRRAQGSAATPSPTASPARRPCPAPATWRAARAAAPGSSAAQYVNGVTSYGYAGAGNKVYSPYFGPAIGTFLSQLP